ncbi:hypothetical protein HBA55_29740 [Pseudomaricurvus alkylphenolicus]|uniref:hypothetical protein n=1 Tax=Pseudomaricurvus alkylphenolicus TaxID=1306991 RepID=UPI0014220940|nr:hypothetical protein [Pseudomaricurvus alkylphenolicus]NIB43822.1 hypothetical protein [Pseudomaricurvus alkylphenolicus]
MQAIPAVVKAVGVAMSAKAVYDGLKEGNLLQATIGAVGAYYGVTNFGSTVATQTATDAGTKAAEQAAGAATMEAGAEQASKVVEAVTGNAAETATDLAGDAANSAITNGAAPIEEAQGLIKGNLHGANPAELGESLNAANNNGASGGLLNPKPNGAEMVGDATEAANNGAGAPAAPGSAPAASGGSSDSFGVMQRNRNPVGFDNAPTGQDMIDETYNAGRYGDAAVEAVRNPPQGNGLLSDAHQWMKDNPVLASTGMQMAGGLLQGYAQYKEQKEAERDADRSRRRRGQWGTSYNNNYRARTRG